MALKRSHHWIGGAALAVLALTVLVGRRLGQGDPAPKPAVDSIFKDVLEAEEKDNPTNPFGGPPPKGIEVIREGDVLRLGMIVVDLKRPEHELQRVLQIFRVAMASYGRNKADAVSLTGARQALTAIAELLKLFPHLGPHLLTAVRAEEGDDVAFKLAGLLKINRSPALESALASALQGGSGARDQRVAAIGLKGSTTAEANQALLAAWRRETDAELVSGFAAILSNNALRGATDEGLRREIIQDFRNVARETADHARRALAVRALIESQRGRLEDPDRALVDDLIAKETDPARRAELSRLKVGIASRGRKMKRSQ